MIYTMQCNNLHKGTKAKQISSLVMCDVSSLDTFMSRESCNTKNMTIYGTHPCSIISYINCMHKHPKPFNLSSYSRQV